MESPCEHNSNMTCRFTKSKERLDHLGEILSFQKGLCSMESPVLVSYLVRTF